ncbi:unnamed protein product [Paramecium sonneborni]|uniref:Transmembrane protein n=1 Tax=Paramecium sonneborni TaxID=65129 RepID=A0A8S1MB30_9CILI|nr:unnamed protein product [Paramecium sonneborni]
MLYFFCLIAIISAQKNNQNNDQKESKEEYELRMSTNIFNSCIIVSYNYLTQENEQIAKDLNIIMEAYEDIQDFEEKIKQQYIASKRIKLESCKHCVKRQTIQGAYQILEELKSKKFNAEKYYYLMDGFQLKNFYDRQIQHKFDRQDDTLYQIIEDFLSKSREAQGIPELGFNDLYPQLNQNNELKTALFGIDIDSSWFSYMILISVVLVVIVIMRYAYTTLQDSFKTKSKKQKKQK